MAKKNNQIEKSRNQYLRRQQLVQQQELKKKKEKQKRALFLSVQIAGAVLLVCVFCVLFYFANRDKNPTVKAACDGCRGVIPIEVCDCNRQCGDKDCKCIENLDPSLPPAPPTLPDLSYLP